MAHPDRRATLGRLAYRANQAPQGPQAARAPWDNPAPLVPTGPLDQSAQAVLRACREMPDSLETMGPKAPQARLAPRARLGLRAAQGPAAIQGTLEARASQGRLGLRGLLEGQGLRARTEGQGQSDRPGRPETRARQGRMGSRASQGLTGNQVGCRSLSLVFEYFILVVSFLLRIMFRKDSDCLDNWVVRDRHKNWLKVSDFAH